MESRPRKYSSLAKALDKSSTYVVTIGKWARKFFWKERTAAWDDEKIKAGREAEIEEIRAMKGRHVRASLALQSLALRTLNRLALDDNAVLSRSETLHWISEGQRLERQARDEVTEQKSADVSLLALFEEVHENIKLEARGELPGPSDGNDLEVMDVDFTTHGESSGNGDQSTGA